MITDIQKTIAEQINARELKFAGFLLMTEKDDAIIINKGVRSLKIIYNVGKDTHTVKTYVRTRHFDFTAKTLEDVYCDQLQDLIEAHFPRFCFIRKYTYG